MKYRGVLSVLKRKDAEDGAHKYQTEYGTRLGQWTLAEGLEIWRQKHAKAR